MAAISAIRMNVVMVVSNVPFVQLDPTVQRDLFLVVMDFVFMDLNYLIVLVFHFINDGYDMLLDF